MRKQCANHVQTMQTMCKPYANLFCHGLLNAIEQTKVKHSANPKIAHIQMVQTQTSFVQVSLHLHGRLHLHVVLEEAAAERGLVVQLGVGPSLL